MNGISIFISGLIQISQFSVDVITAALLLFIFAALSSVTLTLIYQNTEMRRVNENIQDVTSQIEGIDPVQTQSSVRSSNVRIPIIGASLFRIPIIGASLKSSSKAVEISNYLQQKTNQNQITTASKQPSRTPQKKNTGASTLATILNDGEDEHFVPAPESEEAKNLHRQLKRSLTPSEHHKGTIADQLKKTYSQIGAFEELDRSLQELYNDLPKDVCSEDKLQKVRDKTRQTSINLESTTYNNSLEPTLSWFADTVDEFANLHREYTTQQDEIKQIRDLLYPGQPLEEVLNQLESDVRTNNVARPTAYHAAKDYNPSDMRSPSARNLVTTLADTDASQAEITTELDNVVSELNEYMTLNGRLSSTSTATEIQSRIDEALKTCNNIEGYIGEVIAKRLRDDRERLDEDSDVLYRRSAEVRVTVLKDVLNDYAGRSTGDEITDVEEQRREVASELERYRDDYFASNNYNQYSTTIPNHFANLVETLLSRAGQAIQNGERERGAAMTTAAKLTLERVKSMYGSRQIQRQLTDLQKIRSPQYRLVSTD